MEVYVSISSIPSVLNLEVCNKPGGFTINLVILQLQLIYIPWGRTLVTSIWKQGFVQNVERESCKEKHFNNVCRKVWEARICSLPSGTYFHDLLLTFIYYDSIEKNNLKLTYLSFLGHVSWIGWLLIFIICLSGNSWGGVLFLFGFASVLAFIAKIWAGSGPMVSWGAINYQMLGLILFWV